MVKAKPKPQLLHLVFGGELKHAQDIEFKDLSKLDIVGMYPNFAEAKAAWLGKQARPVALTENRSGNCREVASNRGVEGGLEPTAELARTEADLLRHRLHRPVSAKVADHPRDQVGEAAAGLGL